MIFPKKCLGCPPFLGYTCWPKGAGALLLLSAPLPYFLSGVPDFEYIRLTKDKSNFPRKQLT